MRRSRFSEEQIIWMIREHAAGVREADMCHKRCISDATFFQYKSPRSFWLEWLSPSFCLGARARCH